MAKSFGDQVKILSETREANMKEITQLLIEITVDLKRIDDKLLLIFEQEKGRN